MGYFDGGSEKQMERNTFVLLNMIPTFRCSVPVLLSAVKWSWCDEVRTVASK